MENAEKNEQHKLDSRGELAAMADQVATAVGQSEADRDGAMTVMAKAVRDSQQGLLGALNRLLPAKSPEGSSEVSLEKAEKGKGVKAKKGEDSGYPDAASGQKDNDDYDEEADGDEKMGEGYDDMAKSQDLDSDDDGEFYDVTRLFKGVASNLEAIRKSQIRLEKRVERMEKALGAKADSGALSEFRETIGDVLVHMSKGVLGTQEILSNVPELSPAFNPSQQAKFRVISKSLDTAFEGSPLNPEQMLKGMKQRIINEDEFRHWKQHGVFPYDDAKNSALIEKIKAA